MFTYYHICIKNDAFRNVSEYGHTDIVKLLLEHSANIHAKDDEALCLASKYGHTDIINLLKSYM